MRKDGMKIVTLMFFIVLSSFILVGDEKSEALYPIVPGKSVGELVLGSSTKKEVEKAIGKGKKIKYRISFCGLARMWATKYEYADLGIELEYRTLKGRNVLEKIVIDENCKLKTEKGIGIGALREQVELAYGSPETSVQDTLFNGEFYHTVRYGNVVYKFDEKDRSPYDILKHEVSQIEMWYSGEAE